MNEKSGITILLLEDDAAIASGLSYALSQEGYDVTHCADVASGLEAARRGGFDLAVLDVMLPDGSGFDVCAALRDKGSNIDSGSESLSTAVIFLTAADDEANAVRGFDMGADDYVAKPFRLRELLARIRAVLRRRGAGGGSEAESGSAGAEPSGGLDIGSVHIDPKTAKVSLGAQPVELTAAEYKLLLVFAVNKGIVLTREQLLDKLWDDAGSYVNDNTLSVYVKRLREKLGEGIIETVRGIGYRA
jgi:DNA-binding response OmpR family regulator